MYPRIVAATLALAMFTYGLPAHAWATPSLPSPTASPTKEKPTWSPATCENNSERQDVRAYGQYRSSTGTPKTTECVANYEAKGNRGRVSKQIMDPLAVQDNAIYTLGARSVEYLAEGRLIARLATDTMSPTSMWRRSTSAWRRRNS